MQELVGIGVITVYAVDQFQNAGFGLTLSKLLAGFINISYIFSVIFAVYTLDRFGRRCNYLESRDYLNYLLPSPMLVQ